MRPPMASEVSVVSDCTRDPNDLNKHLEVQFDEILGEPEGVHSFDCVWKSSKTCFCFWRNLVYKVLFMLLVSFIAAGLGCEFAGMAITNVWVPTPLLRLQGICIAAVLGCEFAVMAITNIWVLTPLLRVLEINLTVVRKAWTAVLACCVQPCCEAFGGVFVNLKK